MAKAAARDYKPKRKSTGFSGWTGVLCGLALGLGVAAVVYIKDHRPDAPIAKAGEMDRRKSRGNRPPDSEAADSGAEDSAPQSAATESGGSLPRDFRRSIFPAFA